MYTEEEAEQFENYVEEQFVHFDKVIDEIISPDIHLDIIVVPPTEDDNNRRKRNHVCGIRPRGLAVPYDGIAGADVKYVICIYPVVVDVAVLVGAACAVVYKDALT